jgi:hypothetical protein
MAGTKFISLKVSPTTLRSAAGGFDLYWDIQTSGFTPRFMPQFAHTQEGDWTNLLVGPTAAYSAGGVGPKRLSFQSEMAFRVLVFNGPVLASTGPVSYAVFSQNRHDWLHYREMLRREDLGLRKYHGEPGVLLRRIVYGTKCTDCSDETLNDPASSECENCYGTGFEGGYYPPVFIYTDSADSTAEPNNTTLDPIGPSELRVVEAIFPAYPPVKFKDIYVDNSTGHRHEVQSVTADEYRGGTIRQVVTLSRLPISDPVYQIPAAVGDLMSIVADGDSSQVADGDGDLITG